MSSSMRKSRVPVNGSNDEFYRYTMPTITFQKSPGRKSDILVITNISDICGSIGRSVDSLAKWFQYNFQQSVSKSPDGKSIAIKGASPDQIQDSIFEFIQAFVLCPNCGNPETQYLNEKQLGVHCFACGSDIPLKPMKKAGTKTSSWILSNLAKEREYTIATKQSTDSFGMNDDIFSNPFFK